MAYTSLRRSIKFIPRQLKYIQFNENVIWYNMQLRPGHAIQ